MRSGVVAHADRRLRILALQDAGQIREPLTCRACRGRIHRFAQCSAHRRLTLFGHFVEDVAHLVNPGALLRHVRKVLTDGVP